MNNLLRTHDLTRNRLDFKLLANNIKANIHLLGIEAKGLFSADESRMTFLKLQKIKPNIFYHQLESGFEQDAYLKETDQLAHHLIPIFKAQPLIINTKFNYRSVNYYMNNRI
jgi:homoserine O-acetyltransferase